MLGLAIYQEDIRATVPLTVSISIKLSWDDAETKLRVSGDSDIVRG
jgi:hypothetical protein